jgi:hypothetical protein
MHIPDDFASFILFSILLYAARLMHMVNGNLASLSFIFGSHFTDLSANVQASLEYFCLGVSLDSLYFFLHFYYCHYCQKNREEKGREGKRGKEKMLSIYHHSTSIFQAMTISGKAFTQFAGFKIMWMYYLKDIVCDKHRQTDRQTDRQDKPDKTEQTNKQTDRQTC